ncbi:unnamed protein product [Didymodactylos carnosus]|uniref:Bromo domain-containing protein n=1 Tax=Didymodactylos carnosus TaxID=1234261 RepID=A0A814F4X7_9BILA|nr:unnamed protein product [Didymodactylos carnosus]CAF0976634.1 unnamed protein product [Didymodactylos carnosus]CAF3509365.1 unnamed protein product [Didymodactylos carnosus]CAF3749491.1 unnamed protein product [Didymodactylos carnosus]
MYSTSEWPDTQLSNIQKTLQNSWQVPYITQFCRVFCELFNLFEFHQEELEDALLSDNPDEMHPFLQELLLSLLSGLTRFQVNTNNIHIMLVKCLKKCDLSIPSSIPPQSAPSEEIILLGDWKEMGVFEKLHILRCLCDARLTQPDVENLTETVSADLIRFEPCGEDSKGSKMWYFGDTRLYVEKLDKTKSGITSWECVCRTLDEWETFVSSYKQSTKAQDKRLLQTLYLLIQELPDIYSRKDRDTQKRSSSLFAKYAPKRSSTRLETKRQTRIQKEQFDTEQKERIEKFLEYKKKQEMIIAKEKERLEREGRVKKREERASRIRRRAAVLNGDHLLDSSAASADDLNGFYSENSNASSMSTVVANNPTSLENPSSLSNDESLSQMSKTTSSNTRVLPTTNDINNIHQRVLNTLRTYENSWPFLEPVTEDIAPNYFTVIEKPIDLSTIQSKINRQCYLNNSNEFISDIELMVENCKKYNGKRSVLGRISNRLLKYFKEIWSEYQPQTPQVDDIDDINPLKRRRLTNDFEYTQIAADNNNNTTTTSTRSSKTKNYRQLAGLTDDEDDDDEMDYKPPTTMKRSRTSLVQVHSNHNLRDPAASTVYHDHSYTRLREAPTLINDDTMSKRSSTQRSTTVSIASVVVSQPSIITPTSSQISSSQLPTAAAISQFLSQNNFRLVCTPNNLNNHSQDELTKSQSEPTIINTTKFDFTQYVRALLVKQPQQQQQPITTVPSSSSETQTDKKTLLFYHLSSPTTQTETTLSSLQTSTIQPVEQLNTTS